MKLSEMLEAEMALYENLSALDQQKLYNMIFRAKQLEGATRGDWPEKMRKILEHPAIQIHRRGGGRQVWDILTDALDDLYNQKRPII